MSAERNRAILNQFEAYLTQIALSPKTVTNYLADMRSFTRWAEKTYGNDFFLIAVTPEQIRAYRSYLAEEQKRAASTVNRHLQALRKCCAYLAQANLAPVNAAEEISLVSAEKKTAPSALPTQKVEAFLQAAVQTRSAIAKRDAAIVNLLVGAGLRVAETSNLQMDDVIFDYPGVHLAVRDSRGQGKRDIPLSREVYSALKEWLVIRPKNASPYVFLSQEARPVSARTIQRIVSRCAKTAGLNGVTAQLLRRTYALRLLEQTGDLDLVQQRLGHRDSGVTARYLNIESLQIDADGHR